MIKSCPVFVCDKCGKQDFARKVLGRYNDLEDAPPIGWTFGRNSQRHFCPECSEKLNL